MYELLGLKEAALYSTRVCCAIVEKLRDDEEREPKALWGAQARCTVGEHA